MIFKADFQSEKRMNRVKSDTLFQIYRQIFSFRQGGRNQFVDHRFIGKFSFRKFDQILCCQSALKLRILVHRGDIELQRAANTGSFSVISVKSCADLDTGANRAHKGGANMLFGDGHVAMKLGADNTVRFADYW
jgi:prepilin-type processing-associated H-X9-DG protein